jgi:hypothetical protein
MVWIDTISELEYYSPNPQFGCYSDPVWHPSDIILQARYPIPLNPANTIFYEINILQPDGTLIETLSTGSPYFDVLLNGQYVINGVTYNYTNIRCNNYSPGMLSNNCFVIEFKLYDSAGTIYFDKYTQKYILRSAIVAPGAGGVTIAGATIDIELCLAPVGPNPCNTPNVQFVSIFDCIDTFTGDYYGDSIGTPGGYGLYPFPFVKLSNIEGKFRAVPSAIKRINSINCRPQRSETTDKYLLTGNVVFPVWKMLEIQRMMLGTHLYIDSTEYKSEGGVFFEQFGRPYNCQYVYKMSIDFIGCYEWQNFGCSPVCEAQSLYFLIP